MSGHKSSMLLMFLQLVLLLHTGHAFAQLRTENSVIEEKDRKGQCTSSTPCGCMAGPGGPPGIPGVPGMNGWRGDDGQKGEKGDRGERGYPGMHGEIGHTGPPGPEGQRSRKGSTGEPGDEGPVGPQGPKGDRGYPGVLGEKGQSGTSGPQQVKIAFSVFRSQRLGPVFEDTRITFDRVFTNNGGAFDTRTSDFVCPTNGTYLFAAHIMGQENKDAHAWIMRNKQHQVPIHADSRAGYGTGSQTVILRLAVGERVWTALGKGSGLMNDFTTFSGYLLFADAEGTEGQDPREEQEEISNHLHTNNAQDYWRWK